MKKEPVTRTTPAIVGTMPTVPTRRATTTSARASRNTISRAQIVGLIKYARAHNFIITPMGYTRWLENYNEDKHCPCSKERPACPCPESKDEVVRNGHCLCHLLWRDYDAYLRVKLKEGV